MRAKVEEEEKKKPMDIKNTIQFPTLGKATAPAPKGPWGANKTSFKTTVQQMIVNEQKSAEEREAEAERQRAMEGWEVLDCPKVLTPEWGYAFNHYIGLRDREADRIQHLMDIGYWVDPIVIKERSKGNAVLKAQFISDLASDDGLEAPSEPDEDIDEEFL